ncbi:MAG: hypothetical protein LUQ59_06125 [Methanothrix sp.]|nr:hypothetical protein [Methanothrix sp.]
MIGLKTIIILERCYRSKDDFMPRAKNLKEAYSDFLPMPLKEMGLLYPFTPTL